VPSTKPISVETKVTDPGSKPAGTAPPAGICGGGAVVVLAAVVLVVEELRVDVDPGPLLVVVLVPVVLVPLVLGVALLQAADASARRRTAEIAAARPMPGRYGISSITLSTLAPAHAWNAAGGLGLRGGSAPG
jgi:hypothetical protein